GWPGCWRSSTTAPAGGSGSPPDRKSTRLNSSHDQTSYAVFCLKKKKTISRRDRSPHQRKHRGAGARQRVAALGDGLARPRPSRAHCAAFFFNDPATTEIYTLSLHDALPI